MFVPGQPADLSPDWMREVLEDHYPDARVSGIAAARLEGLSSYNGTFAQVAIDAEPAGAAPGSLIVKMLPENERVRAVGTHMGIYLREAAFYNDIGARAGVTVPELAGAVTDTETSASAIVMEDLTHLRTGNQYSGFTIGDARLAVGAYARLHATWWNETELETFDWLPAWNDPQMVEVASGAYRQLWPICSAIFDELLTPADLAAGAALADALAALMETIGQPPYTLAHGDARHDNLLFDDDDGGGGGPHFVDWQFTARGRGTVDLAYYLTQGGTSETVAPHEEELVRAYHDELCAGGVSDYDWETCWREYRLFALYALVFPILAAGLIDAKIGAQRNAIGTLISRGFAAARRLNSVDLLPD